MRSFRGVSALLAGTLLALAGGGVAVAEERVTLTGTYRRMAVERPDGHAYEDLLVTRGRSYRLRLTGARPRPGSTVTIQASTTEGTTSAPLRTTSVRTISDATPQAVTGSTSTLAILAYWTAPDSVTQARAQTQLFSDDATWLKEVAYGQVTLTGKVTPWVRITAPTSGRCYDYADEIMARARAAAAAIGYPSTAYSRTLVYFPKCSGSDTTNLTGWAYEPGDSIWLNGVMDRRTSVHEHGHSFGMGHARSMACVTNGVRVPFGASCTTAEYGDPFDAMGQSGYVAHFSAPHKDDAGWLSGTRKRILTTSSSTFTLPPFERASASPLAVVANSPVYGRRYWLEYRQPLGYDAKLPAGATGGLLIHLDDAAYGPGPYLLDLSPTDGTLSAAVLGAGRSWTAPDGVRFAVGAMSTSGLTVTVSGARPEPVPPSAPRSVAAKQGDARALVTWAAPLSDGNGTIARYVVRHDGGYERSVSPDELSATVSGLSNDHTYTFNVTAVNEAGAGPPAYVSVTPRLSPPTVAINDPLSGATVTGSVAVWATSAAGANSLADVTYLDWFLDGSYWQRSSSGNAYVTWNTLLVGNGAHTVSVTVHDTNNRTGTATATYDVRNQRPVATVTSPPYGGTVKGGVVTLTATAAPAEDGAAIQRVELFDPSGGRVYGTDWSAPYEVSWDVTNVSDGTYYVAARAIDVNSRTGTSATTLFYVDHDDPYVAITSPAAGSTVRGTALVVTADARSGTAGVGVSRVEFVGPSGETRNDYTAPYSASFDTSAFRGSTTLVARVYESSGRWSVTYNRVTVDNLLPAVAVTAPTSGTVVRGTSVTLSGTARPQPGGAAVTYVDVSSSWRGAVRVPVAADGTWSLPWDVTNSYGTHTVAARTVDAAGYRGEGTTWFRVERPAPTVTLDSPAQTATVSTSAPTDLVATVTPAADQATTIQSVCFRYGWSTMCGAQEADGRWAARGITLPTAGWATFTVVVSESDGYSAAYASRTVAVYSPPRAPSDLYAVEQQDAKVYMEWYATSGPWDAPAEWVIRDDRGTVMARVPGEGFSAEFRPPRIGEFQQFTIEGVNAYGTGPRGWTGIVLPQWSLTLQDVTVSRTLTMYPETVTVRARAVRADGLPVAGLTLHLDGLTADHVYTTGSYLLPRTSSTGWTSFTFVPNATADWWVSVPESIDATPYRLVVSAPLRVTVRSRLTATLSRTSMPLGTTTWLTGKVSPATSGRTVYLQRLVDGVWRTTAARGQGYDGSIAFAIKPTVRGTYTYRLYYGADGWRAATWTSGRSFTVY
ncbi:MAG TPA: Ig-like domain-containing protein [Mycobacteriales bacterium]|jgi:hypothetical protein